MPRYSFQVRTGEDVAGNAASFDFRDLNQAIEIALFSMVERVGLDARTMKRAESILEVINEAGNVIARRPITNMLTQH